MQTYQQQIEDLQAELDIAITLLEDNDDEMAREIIVEQSGTLGTLLESWPES